MSLATESASLSAQLEAARRERGFVWEAHAQSEAELEVRSWGTAIACYGISCVAAFATTNICGCCAHPCLKFSRQSTGILSFASGLTR